MPLPASLRSPLALAVAASLALHLAALGIAALKLSNLAALPHRADARHGPRLEVVIIAAAPPQLALDGMLAPIEGAAAAFSKLPRKTRERPGELARERSAPPETAYYSAAEVDVRAVPVTEIVPVNPDLTGRESGRIVLRVLINSGGEVDNVLVVSAEPRRNFSAALLTPFKQARFVPARKAGVPVASEMLVELRYGDAANP